MRNDSTGSVPARRRPMWALSLSVVAVSAGVVGFALTAGSSGHGSIPSSVELPAPAPVSPPSTTIVAPSTTVVVGSSGGGSLSVVAAPKPVVTQVDGLTATTVLPVTTTTEDSGTSHTTTTETEHRHRPVPSTTTTIPEPTTTTTTTTTVSDDR